MTKSRVMRWVRHVARMGIGEVRIGFWWGNIRETKRLEDLGVDGRILLKGFYRNTMGRRELDW
jgi:hypothetical protein